MPGRVIKVAIVGPLASGKSTFINFATDQRETFSESYIPTVPVRIIEQEVPSTTRGRSTNYDVHVYDCSGDTRFEHTWPAISYKLNGTVFVYNPQDKKHVDELNLWYNNFAEKPNLAAKCCLLVGSRKNLDEVGGGRHEPDVQLSTLFQDIPRIMFNGKVDEIEVLKQSFLEFLKKITIEVAKSNDQDE